VPSTGWVFDFVHGWVPYEAHLIASMDHPNIIKFMDVFSDEKYVFLVTELHGCEWRTDNPRLNPQQNLGLREQKPPAVVTVDKPIAQMTDAELLKKRRTACDLFECIDAQYVAFVFA
jgi:hypothetical protein